MQDYTVILLLTNIFIIAKFLIQLKMLFIHHAKYNSKNKKCHVGSFQIDIVFYFYFLNDMHIIINTSKYDKIN